MRRYGLDTVWVTGAVVATAGESDVRWRAVLELARSLTTAPDRSALARAAVAAARGGLGARYARVTVWEGERRLARTLAQDGEPGADPGPDPEAESGGAEPGPDADVPEGTGPPRGAAPPEEVRPPPDPDEPEGARIRVARRAGHGSALLAPLVLYGRVGGELRAARGPTDPGFDARDTPLGAVLAALTAAGLVQHERLAEARRLAFTDALTGLANRRAVDVRLAEALERHRATGAVVSLVVCDINGLKAVNDRYGHAVGDQLLERFGMVLVRCAERLPNALVARLGGDEFCLLAVGATADEVVRVAAEVCRRAARLRLGRGVACGVASTGDPIGAVSSAERLFRLADAAQYRAKTSRSDTPVVAGRHGGTRDPVVRLADRPRGGRERRRFRGRAP